MSGPSKVQDYSVSGSKGEGDHTFTGTAFATGLNQETGAYNAAGGQVLYVNKAAASLTAQHVPSFGTQVTGAGKLNLVNTPDHTLDVNAFSTRHIPKAPIPNFSTHGVGADYSFREKLGASASVSHTPVFKQTDYSLGGNINLHKTPTSSLYFNVGASKTNTPFHNGKWGPRGAIVFTKRF